MDLNKNKNVKDSHQNIQDVKDEMNNAIQLVQDIKNLTISQIDEIADKVAHVLSVEKIKTNQIRNVYGYISRVRNSFNKRTKKNEEIKNMIIFLKPKLAYIAGRIDKVKESKMDKFYKTAIDSISNTNNEELEKALDNFFKLSEAIVAYHRYYAG